MQRSLTRERRGTVAAVALLFKAFLVALLFTACVPTVSTPAYSAPLEGIQTQAESQSAESLVLYHNLCDVARQRIFDQASLANWDSVVAANEAGINSVEDAVAHFNKAVSVAQDPFTFALDPKATAE